jgi:hypothetical protein
MHYKPEDFGHVFAIAFGLSAIFYYAELSEVAYKRWTKVLLLLADADKTLTEIRKREIMKQIEADFAGGMFRILKPLPMHLQQEIARSRKTMNTATLKSALLSFLYYFVFVSHLLTHLLAWISAFVSLVVLLNSGFHPNKEFGLSAMVAFLLLSFSSIIWTLGFYGIFLPIIMAVVVKDPPSETAS